MSIEIAEVMLLGAFIASFWKLWWVDTGDSNVLLAMQIIAVVGLGIMIVWLALALFIRTVL